MSGYLSYNLIVFISNSWKENYCDYYHIKKVNNPLKK
jgi:hypothetical protein